MTPAPRYDYLCPACGLFEAFAQRDERYVECTCGQLAERRPYSGVPQLKGETVSKNIPDVAYAWDKAEREHRAKGWDLDRAVRTMRKGIKEDKEGHRFLDMRGVT